jgi:hypothetical protein
MIEDVISGIVARLRPSSGDDLSGFLHDADYALSELESGVFSSADVLSSEDPRSLVNARIIVSPSVASLQDVSQALLRAFGFMAYPHFQASNVQWYREATVLRFITIISGDAFYVTGTLTATGPEYPKLVKSFDRDFGALHGLVPPLPNGGRSDAV